MFSLENETSFNAIYSYYAKMAHFRNTAEVPIILVGTQGEWIENDFICHEKYKNTCVRSLMEVWPRETTC